MKDMSETYHCLSGSLSEGWNSEHLHELNRTSGWGKWPHREGPPIGRSSLKSKPHFLKVI